MKYTSAPLAVLIVLLVAAQVFQPRPSNPPIDAARTLQARLPVTPQMNAILDRSCRDCHSNATVWPWYSRVAPMSWIVVSHVNDGRRALNFSDWAQYDAAKADHELEEMCEHVREGEMPLDTYTWAHSRAALSPEDVTVVCAWTDRVRTNAPGDAPAASMRH
jgi:hypothetical protein